MSRDILAPPLHRMSNNRCYRVNVIHNDFKISQYRQDVGQNSSPYVEEDLYDEDDDEATCTVEEIKDILHLRMHVPSVFFGGLIGSKGTTKRRIESETETEILVPRKEFGTENTKADEVLIKGKTRTNVHSARRKISLLVASLRNRTKPTHFLCIASNTDEIRNNFNSLKKSILELNCPGVSEDLFQLDSHLHLTLHTCILLDDVDRNKAITVLQNCRSFLKHPFTIRISGLEIMNDDPSAVGVLYARVEAVELLTFAEKMMDEFIKAGLASKKYNIKLHMTIMNQRYARGDSLPKNSIDTRFDARDILKRFGNFHFGSFEASEVHLCILRSKQANESFYKITSSLSL